MKRTRSLSLSLAAVCIVTAALAGCDTPEALAPAPTATSTPAPVDEGVSEPEPAPVKWAPVPLKDGLMTAEGTTLIAPVEEVSEGRVSGWYAALEFTSATTSASIADAYVAQLTKLGLTVTQDQAGEGALAVSAQGTGSDTVVRYEIQVVPPTQGAQGVVTLMAATEEVSAR